MHFPDGFLWGAATAAHQVEGNNSDNDWWECEQDGRLPHRSGAACEHYDRYGADFDLARSLGHNAHRLSLEWSRIEPRPGAWQQPAIDHYREVIAAARARGLEPIVTLHHFSNPAWFTAAGGWTRHDAPALFARYVERVAAALGNSVRYWLTLNEPTVYLKRVCVNGDWPPCRRHTLAECWRVLRNMARAHRAAYALLHAGAPDCQVSFAHSAPWVEPCDRSRWRDRLAAYARDFVLNRLFFRLLGRRPELVLDFIALNYYTRQVVTTHGTPLRKLFGDECRDQHHHGAARRFNSLGWEISPDSLRAVLLRFSRYGRPLLVTENGIATHDESERSEYLRTHLQALARSLHQGIDVRGYLYWTLYDNFEWREGFQAQFGLCSNDLATQQRTPRPAALLYADICRRNAIT